MDRVDRARAILHQFQVGTYTYLGAGFAGVVFHDGTWVYKVHVPISETSYGEQDHLPFLAAKLDAFRDATHLYALRELTCYEGVYILVYPYEPSEPVSDATELEWCSFLAELWERRIICRSVSLTSNFRRVRGVLKLVDYEIEPYDDNLFLNVAVRAFIQLPEVRARVGDFGRLRRSTINAFELPELSGFSEFLGRVGDTIAARARRSVWTSRRAKSDAPALHAESPEAIWALLDSNNGDAAITVNFNAVDLRSVALDALRHGRRLVGSRVVPPDTAAAENDLQVLLNFRPLIAPPQPVTLLIKACAQDVDFVEQAVEHIVGALSGPERFSERVLALDVVPRTRFVRQFTNTANVERLLECAQHLVDRGIIDRFVVSPEDESIVREINRRWFGLDTPHTHTDKGVPVVPQLHAFESLKTDAVLQADVDVLVGVRDTEHLVLTDMLRVLEDPQVVSVAFPICRRPNDGFQTYFGFENGGFVPEVRCCLLLRSRLQALRPLPNVALPTGLSSSWYRAVETRQRETGMCSVRGGPSARFFIHPQNYRKTSPSTWPALIDRVEQLAVPDVQMGQLEVRGALSDWNLPARDEDTVVIVVIGDELPSQVAGVLLDLEGQSLRQFGVILVDASGKRRARWIAESVGFAPSRLTCVDHHESIPKVAAILGAVRAYVSQDDACICLMDAGDVLLSSKVIGEVRNRMEVYESDVLIGKELSTEFLGSVGKHAHDLLEPRRAPETLADGLRAVRRYLLDALDIRDVRIKRAALAGPNTFTRLSKSHAWLDDPHLLSLVVPSVELGRNPVSVDHFHILRRRSPTQARPSEEVLDVLRTRPSRRAGDFVRGRKVFLPNLRRIEIDITYDCNLKCLACNRSCTQAPTREHMRMDQIASFIDESIALGKKWEFINVLGGEPTLHPEFHGIVQALLSDYVDAFSAETVVQVTSNGYGGVVQRRLSELPAHARLVINRESFKDTPRVPYFTPFNDAPIDDPAFANADYKRACWVTAYCGIGLNHLGYFPCSVAGGIERVLRSGGAIKTLAEVDAHVGALLDRYCRLCGNFKHYAASRGDFVPRSEKEELSEPVVSETWRYLYSRRQE